MPSSKLDALQVHYKYAQKKFTPFSIYRSR